jgi:hypothetical protein
MKNIMKSTLAALVGLVAFTACEDDRDSNPVLNTSGDVTFVLNAPEFAGVDVALGATESVPLTWSQPVLTTDNAPLGAAGTYGFMYEVQLSKDGNFTKTFADALAEVTDEEGNYTGTPTGHDYTVLPTTYNECKADLNPDELNTALNEVNVWAEGTELTATDAYLRVVAIWAKADGTTQVLATSNVQKVSLIPSKWIDITETPAAESYLWMPGNGNGWNHGVAPILVSSDGEIYEGYAYMDGDFKFTTVDYWGEELNNGSFTTVSDNIDLGDGGGGNLGFTGDAGMYYIVVNMADMSITATPVTWSVIGGFNNWGGDEFLTYDTANHCMSVTITFDTDTEWKFRRDSDWAINFGGSLDALEQDGANFSATAGTHTIQLFIERPAQDGLHATID